MNPIHAWRVLWSRKASEGGRIIAQMAGQRPQGTPRDYRKFAKEGFAENVIAFRAVNEVARSAASVPWAVFDTSGEERKRLPDSHPLAKLLRMPNPQQAGSEFFEAVYGHFQLAGNSYIEAAGQAEAFTKGPDELWPLRPDRMRVVPDAETGAIGAYKFSAGGKTKTWEVDPATGRSQVLHLKTFNPTNDFYGLSPIEPGAKSIDARNEADDWNLNLLRNNARPSGALIYKPESGDDVLEDEQFDKLKAELDELYQGSQNSGRPMILHGGLEWKEMSMSPKDMDFLKTKNTSSRDIALAFGVPPQLLGIPGDSTFSNYREARLSMWEETIVPLIYHVRDELNNWLVPQFTRRTNESIELDAVLEDVPALSLRSERRWERISASDFMTINEKRAAVGMAEIDGGDELLVPSSVLPLEAVTGDAEDDDQALDLSQIHPPERQGEQNKIKDEIVLAYGQNN